MTLNTSTRIAVTPPDAPKWWRAADGFDHAFSAGSGWMRSRCGDVRWTVALTPALFGPSNPCPTCDLLVNGTEGEKAEAFGS